MQFNEKLSLSFLKLRSIKARFIIIGIGLFILVFFLVGYIAIRIESRNIQKSSNAGVEAFARLATKPIVESYDLYFDSGYYKFAEVFSNILKLNPNIKSVQIVSVSGEIVFDSKFFTPMKYLESKRQYIDSTAFTKADPTFFYMGKNPELKEIIYPYFTDWQSHPYSIRYRADYSNSKNDIRVLIYESILLMLGLTICSVFLLSFATNKSLIDPLKDVINTTKFISKGDYGKRAKHRFQDEVGDLADSVNKMAHTLEQNIADLKELDKVKDEFIEIAAHNLKIPLNHIKFNLDYLMKNLSHDLGKRDYALLSDISVNYEKLQLLSEDLTNITAINQGTMQNSVFMPLDLIPILQEVADEKMSSSHSKNIKLEVSLIKTAPILGDYLKIKQAFLNLLDNAIKFTPQNGLVELRITETKNNYEVDIKDTGVGMTKEEVKKLFQKFYRAPSSAIRSPDSAGLGLYLTKLIIDIHHGFIYANSAQNKGSKFTVVLLKSENFKKLYPFK